jgi:hypothetical protein
MEHHNQYPISTCLLMAYTRSDGIKKREATIKCEVGPLQRLLFRLD